MTVYCHVCGDLLPPVGLYCPNCGGKRLVYSPPSASQYENPSARIESYSSAPLNAAPIPVQTSRESYETDGFVLRLVAPQGISFGLKCRDSLTVFCIIASLMTGAFFHFGEISDLLLCVAVITCAACINGLGVSYLGFGYEHVVYLRPTFLILMYLPMHVWAFVSFGFADIIWRTTTLPDIIWVAVGDNSRAWGLAFIGTAIFFVALSTVIVSIFFERIYESSPERYIKQ